MIPVFAAKLGIDEKTYYELAKNIGRMQNISKDRIEEIINIEYKKIPEKIAEKIFQLRDEMFNDLNVFKKAGLKYGGKIKENIFTAGIIDYFVRNKISCE